MWHDPYDGRAFRTMDGGVMKAVWYERQGPAAEVLTYGELPDPETGAGEVRVRLRFSGINPGDTKKRLDAFGYGMSYPRVIPHSDGSGVIEAVGDGVDERRVGQRVWVWGAQSYRAFGTAAELVVVPERLAVVLPETVSDELGACLGIPGITAHRCVFADGPVAGRTVLVHGVLGGVATMAAGLAHWAGARVIGTVRRSTDLADAARLVPHVVALDDDPAAAIRAVAPDGVDRIIEVALAANAELDAAVVANDAVIAAYATNVSPTPIPFWDLLFNNLTLRLLGSDDFSDEARASAVADLTDAAAAGALHPAIADPLPLVDCARAHDLVDAGSRGRILLRVE